MLFVTHRYSLRTGKRYNVLDHVPGQPHITGQRSPPILHRLNSECRGLTMSNPNGRSQEERVIAALEEYASDRTKNLRALATKYAVPKSTLIARASGRATRRDSRKAFYRLNMAQEESLIEWIEKLGRQGFPPRTDMVRDMANSLLCSLGSTNGTADEAMIQRVGKHLGRTLLKTISTSPNAL